jgi:hypothetical protein
MAASLRSVIRRVVPEVCHPMILTPSLIVSPPGPFGPSGSLVMTTLSRRPKTGNAINRGMRNLFECPGKRLVAGTHALDATPGPMPRTKVRLA